MNEVIAHQADLRFVNMAGQRFLDEAKKYQKDQQNFRNNYQKSPKSRRSGEGEFGVTRDKVKSANERYQNLRQDVEGLMNKLNIARERQQQYYSNVFKAEAWFQDAEQKLAQMEKEPVPSQPHQIQEQIEKLKNFNTEVFAQGKQVDELRKVAKNLQETMKDLGADDQTLRDLSSTCSQMSRRLASMADHATLRSNQLQTALVQSQGVQEGIDGLLTWLKDTEVALNNMRPISLNQDVLNDLIQELQVIRSDVESHVPSVDSVNRSSTEIMKSSEPSLAKNIEGKLQSLNERFDNVAMRCTQRGEDLQIIATNLSKFHDRVQKYNEWLVPTLELLESQAVQQLEARQFQEKVEDISKETKAKMRDLEKIRKVGSDLINHPRAGDSSQVKDKMAECERNWHDFNEVLDERQHQAHNRQEQSSRYEGLRDEILHWLTDMENKVDSLAPIAIDIEVIEKQIEELEVCKPVCSVFFKIFLLRVLLVIEPLLYWY